MSKLSERDEGTMFERKQFECEKMILEPMFRYIPERAVMQRLILRAATMKDDLAEFNLDGEMEMAGETLNPMDMSGVGQHLTESPDLVRANGDSI